MTHKEPLVISHTEHSTVLELFLAFSGLFWPVSPIQDVLSTENKFFSFAAIFGMLRAISAQMCGRESLSANFLDQPKANADNLLPYIF